jgi:hypothetical protein
MLNHGARLSDRSNPTAEPPELAWTDALFAGLIRQNLVPNPQARCRDSALALIRAVPHAAPRAVPALSPIFRVEGGSAQNRDLGSGFQGSRKISTIHAIWGMSARNHPRCHPHRFLARWLQWPIGGYVSKEEGINSSDTHAVRQFDTNQLYSLPYLSRLFGY